MKTWQRLMLPVSVLVCSCSGSSSQTTPGTHASSTCGQTCQDAEVGYALDDTIWLLWNENLAGQPSGAQSKTVSCPLGGTAQITGTTGVASNGIDTAQLTLSMQNCGNLNTGYSLAFTGTVTWGGSFNSSAGNAITFKSASLIIGGAITLYDNPTIDETCAVSLTDTYDKTAAAQSTWLTGLVCGRTVSL